MRGTGNPGMKEISRRELEGSTQLSRWWATFSDISIILAWANTLSQLEISGFSCALHNPAWISDFDAIPESQDLVSLGNCTDHIEKLLEFM
jgi:hypothetical protein